MIYGFRRMIYLLRKHDIISVPSYAAGIYHPPQVDIIIRYSNQCFAEQSYFFSSLFTLIFSLETTILEKREERIDKSEENKRNDNLLSKIVVSFWSWWRDLNPRPIDYESIALPLRHTSKICCFQNNNVDYIIALFFCQVRIVLVFGSDVGLSMIGDTLKKTLSRWRLKSLRKAKSFQYYLDKTSVI